MEGRSEPDLSRVSQLIPHVQSTIESFQNILQSGTELRTSNAFECKVSLAELREMLSVVIQNSYDSGNTDGINEQLALHDKLTALLQRMEQQELPDINQLETSKETKLEPVDTHEVLDLIEKQEEEDLNIPPEDFTCTICYEDVEAKDGFMYQQCFHYFCRECLEGYYNTNIMCGDVVNIQCPHSECDAPVIVRDIQQIVTAEMFERFENFCVLASLRVDPTARWCPTLGCEGVSTGEQESSAIITCNLCQTKYCYGCSQKAHTGFTCTEYAKTLEEDDPKTKKWKKRHGVKNCPHCGLETIRASGCPDMLCVGCKRSWNWYGDKPGEWDGDGLIRKSETKLETAAFIYPRIVKQAVGSRELREDGHALEVTAVLGILGIAGVPLTVVCVVPAVAIKSGRGAKNKIAKLGRRFSRSSN